MDELGKKFQSREKLLEAGRSIDVETFLEALKSGPHTRRGQSAANIVRRWVGDYEQGSGSMEEKEVRAVARITARQSEWGENEARAVWEQYKQVKGKEYMATAPSKQLLQPELQTGERYKKAVEIVIAEKMPDSGSSSKISRVQFVS